MSDGLVGNTQRMWGLGAYATGWGITTRGEGLQSFISGKTFGDGREPNLAKDIS